MYLILERKEGRNKERERNQLPLTGPQSGTEPTTQALPWTTNGTSNLLFCGMTVSQLSHTGQGWRGHFGLRNSNRIWSSFLNHQATWSRSSRPSWAPLHDWDSVMENGSGQGKLQIWAWDIQKRQKWVLQHTNYDLKKPCNFTFWHDCCISAEVRQERNSFFQECFWGQWPAE